MAFKDKLWGSKGHTQWSLNCLNRIKLCPLKIWWKRMGEKITCSLQPNNDMFFSGFFCPHHQNRWKCRQALSSKWLFHFEHVVVMFLKTKAKKSTIMSFKCFIYQTHHKFMGVAMGMGCHRWQCHGVHSFEWLSITCNKLVFSLLIGFNSFLVNFQLSFSSFPLNFLVHF